MIDHCVTRATEYDRQWGYYFLRHGLTPLEVVYEDLVTSYHLTLSGVLDFLEVPHGDLPETEPPLEQMADAKSLEWYRKYRKMKEEESAGIRHRDALDIES
jgi:LPS sulfotransferase NodH